jgi:hypothetical protein
MEQIRIDRIGWIRIELSGIDIFLEKVIAGYIVNDHVFILLKTSKYRMATKECSLLTSKLTEITVLRVIESPRQSIVLRLMGKL